VKTSVFSGAMRRAHVQVVGRAKVSGVEEDMIVDQSPV
jgi:hypothetical protein